MTTMYDSTAAGDIPEDAEAVAGYVNGGESEWAPADWARFPDAKVVRHITTSAVNEGDTADFENGDLKPAQGPGWVAKRVASGLEESELWAYTNLDNWEAVANALRPFAGGWWVADWTGHAPEEPLTLPTGERATAVQYANPSTSGGHFDLSVIFEAPAPAGGGGGEGGDVQLPELQEGSTGDSVKTWQSILNGRGGAGLTVDGVFGPLTKERTQSWQRVFGIAQDGIVGPVTWSSAFA